MEDHREDAARALEYAAEQIRERGYVGGDYCVTVDGRETQLEVMLEGSAGLGGVELGAWDVELDGEN